jgi:hypothetical protein
MPPYSADFRAGTGYGAAFGMDAMTVELEYAS